MAFKEVPVDESEVVPTAGEFFKFQAIGDKLAGIFISYKERKKDFGDGKGEKTFHDYTFKTKDGLRTISANFDLHARMKAAQVKMGLKPGHKVMITYTNDRPIEGQSTPMKQHKVQVDTETSAPKPPPPPPPAEDDFEFP